QAIARLDRLDVASQLFRDVGRGDDDRLVPFHAGDVIWRVVVAVRVSDKEEVGRRKIVGKSPRIDVHDELLAPPAEGRLLVPREVIKHLRAPFDLVAKLTEVLELVLDGVAE